MVRASVNVAEPLPLAKSSLQTTLGLGASGADVIFALGELLVREAASSLSDALSQKVEIGEATIETVDLQELDDDTWSGHLVVDLQLELDSRKAGSSVILLPQDDVQSLLPSTDGDGPNLDLFSDLVHGLVARLSEKLTGRLRPLLQISVTEANATDELAETDGALVKIEHQISIDDQIFRVDHLVPASVLDAIAVGALQEDPAPVEAVVAPLSYQNPPVGGTAVHPAEFAPLEPEGTAESSTNLDLLLGVPLRVTVELGRRQMTIQEVLELGPGSVIELNRIAGEPVDILVNNQFIARGEVVVVDENFGVRVTEIVSPDRRLAPQISPASSG